MLNASHRTIGAIGLVAATPFFVGCAATHVALNKRDLDVQTKMSATVFLDPVSQKDKTAFVQFRNTSDKQALDLSAELSAAIANKGYTIVMDPDKAHYILQTNVLHVGKTSASAAENALNGGYGGSLGAGMGVAAAAYATGHTNDKGVVAAALIGAIGNTVANAMIKDVYFSIVTDIQIKERSKTAVNVNSQHTLAQGTSGSSQSTFSESSEYKTYQTRIVSTANKVNLEFAEAEPELRTGLVRSLSGLF